MSERKIIGAWETPTNEGTAIFRVGDSPTGYSISTDWIVGRISMMTLVWIQGATEEFKRYANSRVDIYDDEGTLRVSLPTGAVGIEYAGKEDA